MPPGMTYRPAASMVSSAVSAGGRQIGADRGDRLAVDEDVGAVRALGGDDRAVGDERAHRSLLARSRVRSGAAMVGRMPGFGAGRAGAGLWIAGEVLALDSPRVSRHPVPRPSSEAADVQAHARPETAARRRRTASAEPVRRPGGCRPADASNAVVGAVAAIRGCQTPSGHRGTPFRAVRSAPRGFAASVGSVSHQSAAGRSIPASQPRPGSTLGTRWRGACATTWIRRLDPGCRSGWPRNAGQATREAPG